MARVFSNRFAGTCIKCGGHVPARKGICSKQGGKFVVWHDDGDCVSPTWDLGEDIAFDEYQQAIIDTMMRGSNGEHVLVDAKAGTGKTTVQCVTLNRLHKLRSDLSIVCLAFGAEDGKRMAEKLMPGIESATTHSFTMRLVRAAMRGAKLNERDKVRGLLDMVIGPDDRYENLRGWVGDLLDKVHADAVLIGDHDGYCKCIEDYELEIPEDEYPLVFKHVDSMLRHGDNVREWGFTFNEALYFVATKDIAVPQYDIIGVDECQDFNRAQLILLQKLSAGGGRVMAVGDPNQSLFAFRGAQHDSFEQIRDFLSSTDRGAKDYLMPKCRRCPRLVVQLAQQIVPSIQWLDDAPEGEVSSGLIHAQSLPDLVGAGDMVVCRTNAPLANLAWMLTSLGKKFYMRGAKQEGWKIKGLIKLLSGQFGGYASATDDIVTVLDRADKWLDERRNSSKGMRFAEHQGRVEVIKVLADKALTVDDLIAAVDEVFVPPPASGATDCVILSTIHRAKGSECENTYHLQPELCPHKRAVTEKQRAQEFNALYVAQTRCKRAYIETVGKLDGSEKVVAA